MEAVEDGCLYLTKKALKQRMFRSKPYIKCMQCLYNNRLRCKNCMADIKKGLQDYQSHKVYRRTYSNLKQGKYQQYSSLNQTTHFHHTPHTNQKSKEKDKENHTLSTANLYTSWIKSRIFKREQQEREQRYLQNMRNLNNDQCVGLRGNFTEKVSKKEKKYGHFYHQSQ